MPHSWLLQLTIVLFLCASRDAEVWHKLPHFIPEKLYFMEKETGAPAVISWICQKVAEHGFKPTPVTLEPHIFPIIISLSVLLSCWKFRQIQKVRSLGGNLIGGLCKFLCNWPSWWGEAILNLALSFCGERIKILSPPTVRMNTSKIFENDSSCMCKVGF